MGYIVFAALFKLAGMYDFEAKVKNLELMIRLLSIGVGAGLFVGLYSSDRANQFLHEVVAELARVTWPSQKESWNNTFIVVVAVLVTSLFLWGVDTLWAKFIQMVL